MTAEVARHQLVSVEDYIAGEIDARERHEYVGGRVYAMGGGNIGHGRIVGNIHGIAFAQLRGKPCQPFSNDLKVRIQRHGDTRFYYPDGQIVCRSNPLDWHFQDEPVVILEVLSDSTRRIDSSEKREAYLSIPSLQAYVMVEQDEPAAVVWRRTDSGFVREEHVGLEAVLQFPEVSVQLPLREIYEGALPTP